METVGIDHWEFYFKRTGSPYVVNYLENWKKTWNTTVALSTEKKQKN